MSRESREEESLLKYNTPILVSTSVGKKPGADGSGGLPGIKAQPTQKTAEDFLNSILPPKEYTDKGKLWVRYVSPTPATVVDVLKLKTALDKRLENG